MEISQLTQLPSLRHLDRCWILYGDTQPQKAELELQNRSRVVLNVCVHMRDLRRNREKV